MTVRQDRIASATVGTNHWVWDNPSYLSWKSRPSSVIWICGKPGSGKSVLAKTMQTRFLERSSSTQVLVLSWFYSARDNLVLHRQMFLAILSQLLSQDATVFSFIKEIYRSLLSSRGDVSSTHWSIINLQKAISAIFQGFQSRPVSALCIVDGLDESNVEHSEMDCSRRDALKFLTNLTSTGMPLRITFLSRPSDDIKRALKHHRSISMHEVNRPDIEYLIDKGVEILALRLDRDDSDSELLPHSSPSKRRRLSASAVTRSDSMQDEYFRNAVSEKKSLLSEIDNYLRANAKGVVLWVITVLDILQRRCQEEPFCDSQSLTEHLKSLPVEMMELYSRITSDLLQLFEKSPNNLKRARRVLMWVSVSTKYRMQLQDLLEVISYDFENPEINAKPMVFVGFTGWSSFRGELERLCGPFVEIIPILPRGEHFEERETTCWDTVQLAHETVRTFLQQDRNSLELGFSSAEAEMAVREDRRTYMRQTLPPLTPLLLSSPANTDDDYSMFCNYMESRPVLCFILKTLEFELQHLVHQKEGKALLADAVNHCFPLMEVLRSPHQEHEILPGSGTTIILNLFERPFSFAGSLLRMLGYLEFTNPVDGGKWERLHNVFFLACSTGQLNAVNALSALLPYLHVVHRSGIQRAIRDTIVKMGLDHFDHLVPPGGVLDLKMKFLSPSRYKCIFSGAYEPVTSSSRAHAAISQVYGKATFQGRDLTFEEILAALEVGSPLTQEPADEVAIYHRTPFTKLLKVETWYYEDSGHVEMGGEGSWSSNSTNGDSA